MSLEVATIGDDVDRFDAQNLTGRLGVCVSRPVSTTRLVTACSTISLFFASTFRSSAVPTGLCANCQSRSPC
jgi:hypothetical protein